MDRKAIGCQDPEFLKGHFVVFSVEVITGWLIVNPSALMLYVDVPRYKQIPCKV